MPSWHHLSWAGTGEERSQIQPLDDLWACLAWPQAACSAARSVQVLSRFIHCRRSTRLQCRRSTRLRCLPRHLRTVGHKGLRSSTGSAFWRHFGHHQWVRKGVRKGHVPYMGMGCRVVELRETEAGSRDPQLEDPQCPTRFRPAALRSYISRRSIPYSHSLDT